MVVGFIKTYAQLEKKRRKKYGGEKPNHTLKNRIFIDLRPEVVNNKERFGD
jgi:IS30 family transposase